MKTTAPVMKLVKRIDRNTRALAKVVSAIDYVVDTHAFPGCSEGVPAAVEILQKAQFDIIQERRNLRIQLWVEVDKQSKGSRS